ncbi:MAG: tRNA (adenosine(37)-N6)-threonylcarbamoyltransferase complex dimerization subunit type 1 TsaB [Pseudomonadota bacterium]
MISLAIESSTESCSVALQAGEQVLERWAVQPQEHAKTILPWSAELLAEAGLSFGQLDRLVVSRGPGGFTSLRIGLGIVQGLALAHDLPVHPVSSLEALAETADPNGEHTHLLALFDARMGEVYAAWNRQVDGQRVRDGDELLCPPQALRCPEPGPWAAVGPGVERFRADLIETLGDSAQLPDEAADTIWPQARALLTLADQTPTVAGHEITPTYLRDQVTG